MKHRALLLLSAAFAPPALADAPPSGEGSFADGRGHIAFEAGLVDMSVDPVRGDGVIEVDGTPVVFAQGVDRVDGRLYGGEISYVLPGEDTPSWFGRNLRVFGGYEHHKADAWSRHDAIGPTITSGFDFGSVSADGRAFALSFNHDTHAETLAGLFSPTPAGPAACLIANAGNFSTGFQDAGPGNTLDCSVTATTAFAQTIVTTSEGAWVAMANAATLPGVPIATEMRVYSRYGVIARRGEAGFAGDHVVSPTLSLSPSLSVSIGERRADFLVLEAIGDDLDAVTIFALRSLDGNLITRDAGLNLGLRAGYAAGGGFDLFASLGGAVLRRKTEMTFTSAAGGRVFGEDTFALALDAAGSSDQRRSDAVTAFQGTIEAGAGFTFDPAIGIGPLRLSLAGGVTFDSDVPTYGNLGFNTLDAIGPLTPAQIDYTGETTFTLKGAITFELP
jgi:hypothetical protein